MSDYTPTTEEVPDSFSIGIEEDFRETYIDGEQYNRKLAGCPEMSRFLPGLRFDRWLAEVKAQAWEEGLKMGYADWSVDANPYRQGENK